VDFISVPVTVGFTSATSVIIACSQLKGLLGLKFEANGFLDTVNKVWNHIPKTRPWDATLGFTCIIVLLLLRVRKLYSCTWWSIFVFSLNRVNAYKVQVAVFWVVMPCSEMVGYQCFREPCCLHLQGEGRSCLCVDM
jgi:MFS superfamily sulfate permease-like transporter